MPKLKNQEVNGIETLEFNDSDSVTISEMVLSPDKPVYHFGRALKYVYDEGMSQEEKQAFRRKARRNAERTLKGLPLNPNQNRVKKSSEEKAIARRDRRQIRNEIPYRAMAQLQRLPEYAGMSIDDIRASLRDEIVNG